jgi:phenylacetic acid degradation operon negative regulatory protein
VVVTDTAAGDSTITIPAASASVPDDGSVPTRLLVLGMAHRDGSIHAPELYSVTDAVGLSLDQVRSCLRRLVAEDLFERVGDGRDAVYRATAAGLAVLSSTKQRHLLAYAQDAAGRGWDRQWRLVAFAIPEVKRAARDAFRDRLLALGAAPIQNGLYVSPHRWQSEVHDAAGRLGIAEHVTTSTTDDLTVGGESNPRRLADLLWSLGDVAATYQDFIETYRRVPDDLDAMRRRHERLSEKDFLPGALQIAIRFNQCFERDPLLPPELLPKPWPGREARDVLAKCRKLGVLAREDKSGPALFRVFDDVIAELP